MTVISAVRVRGTAPTDRVTASLQSAFRPFSYEGPIDWDEQRRTRSTPWTIEVVLAAPFAAFFVKFGEAAGADAYQSLRAWIDRLRQDERERALELQITAGTATVAVPSALPNAALEALSTTDWSDIEAGKYEWDASRRRWRRLGTDS